MKNTESNTRNHRKHKKTIKVIFKDNWKFLSIIFVIVIFLIGNKIDSINKNISSDYLVDLNKPEYQKKEDNNVNYNAIITIIDGEGESTFTKVWGDLINEGYPICSNLVNNCVGQDGFMSWETIEALNNVGIEFIFHTTSHQDYNSYSLDDVKEDIEIGTSEMKEHDLDNRFIVWRNEMRKEIYETIEDMLDGGFAFSNGANTINADKEGKIKMQYCYDASYYSLSQLKNLINSAVENNGWLVLFTRNPQMNEEQIDIYRQAFEYAKQHNVAVVTASEGYDLYYGNKLGNN